MAHNPDFFKKNFGIDFIPTDEEYLKYPAGQITFTYNANDDIETKVYSILNKNTGLDSLDYFQLNYTYDGSDRLISIHSSPVPVT